MDIGSGTNNRLQDYARYGIKWPKTIIATTGAELWAEGIKQKWEIPVKEVIFIASSHDDLYDFPPDVRQEVGFSLYVAQRGDKALNAVPLVGFGGAGVLEIVSSHEGDTFRAVYTVSFAEFVYVLHAFKKKSKSGRATPRADMALVRQRLKAAEKDYESRIEKRAGQKSAG